MITWFKNDNYEDFTILDKDDKLVKFVIKQYGKEFKLYYGNGNKVDNDYVKEYTKTTKVWCVQDIDKMLLEGYHFPRLSALKTDKNKEELKKYAETIISSM